MPFVYFGVRFWQPERMPRLRKYDFELGPIEMEFQVVARKEFGGDAKLGFHIFVAEATLGGSGKGSDERTQR